MINKLTVNRPAPTYVLEMTEEQASMLYTILYAHVAGDAADTLRGVIRALGSANVPEQNVSADMSYSGTLVINYK